MPPTALGKPDVGIDIIVIIIPLLLLFWPMPPALKLLNPFMVVPFIIPILLLLKPIVIPMGVYWLVGINWDCCGCDTNPNPCEFMFPVLVAFIGIPMNALLLLL